MSGGFTFTMDQGRFNSEVGKFLKRIPREMAEPAVRKITFDVLSDTVVGIGGFFGGPKRVDTGRYRAAWGVAAKDAGLPGAAGLPRSPDSHGGDGSARWAKGLLATGLTVSNHVEYGGFVEFGTRYMEPGHHLKTALLRVGNDLKAIRKQIEAGLKDAAK